MPPLYEGEVPELKAGARASENGEDAVQVDRLDHVLVEARFLRRLEVLRLSPARHGDEDAVRGLRTPAQAARQVVAVHLWQPDIEERDLRTQARRGRERGLAV